MSSLFQHATHSKTFPGVRLWLPPAPCPLTSALTARWLSALVLAQGRRDRHSTCMCSSRRPLSPQGRRDRHSTNGAPLVPRPCHLFPTGSAPRRSCRPCHLFTAYTSSRLANQQRSSCPPHATSALTATGRCMQVLTTAPSRPTTARRSLRPAGAASRSTRAPSRA